MNLSLILFFYFLTVTYAHFVQRIVGGQNAEPHAFPNMVGVYCRNSPESPEAEMFCGGTIYLPKWIVSTGDCISVIISFCSPEDIIVVAGKWNLSEIESFEQERTIEFIRIHDDHEPNEIGSSIDLALLKLYVGLELNDYVSILPFSSNMSYPSGTAVIIGWGGSTANEIVNTLLADILQIMNVEIVPMLACEFGIKQTLQNNGFVFTQNSFNSFHFCTGSFTSIIRGPFAGDNGGPLMQLNATGQYEVVGVLSVGVGLPELGVYIHVAPFVEWINSEINNNPDL